MSKPTNIIPEIGKKIQLFGCSYAPVKAEKASTFGYEFFETDDIVKYIKILNKYATVPLKLYSDCRVPENEHINHKTGEIYKCPNGGHRKSENVEEIMGSIRFDLDEEGEEALLESKISDLMFIKKPSTNNYKHSFKWHYEVFVTGQSNDIAEYTNQVKQFCEDRSISLKDMNATYSPIQNLNPYKNGKAVEEGVGLTIVHEGKIIALPNPLLKQKELEPSGIGVIGNTYPPDEVLKMLMATSDEYKKDDNWLLKMIGSAYALLSDADRQMDENGSYPIRRIVSEWVNSKWKDKLDTKGKDRVSSLLEQAQQGVFKELNGGTLIKEAREGGYLFPDEEIGFAEIDRMMDLLIVTDGSKYWIIEDGVDEKISPPMPKQGKDEWIKRMGINPKKLKQMGIEPENISGIVERADYSIDGKGEFSIDPHPTDVLAYPVLMVRKNPLYGVEPIDFDEEIIEDFTQGVWGGYAEDLIRTVGLTIRFGSDKNIIGLVAKSRKGKTILAKEGMGAAEVKMGGLMKAMNAEKGLGASVIQQMKDVGILLVNEVDRPLTAEFKHFDTGKLQLDQFGAGGGTTLIDVHATILTSVHTKMFSQAGSEMVERCLLFDVDDNKCRYVRLIDSPVFNKDRAKYKEHTQAFIKWILKEAIVGDYTLDDLKELQEKYALPKNNNVEEIRESILADVIAQIKYEAEGRENPNADFSEQHSEYYALRKSDVENLLINAVNERELYNDGETEALLMKKLIPSTTRKKVYGKKRYYIDMNCNERASDTTDFFDELVDDEEGQV